MVVIANRLPAKLERLCGKILVIARVAFLDRASEQCLVARGSDLIVIRQAGCVDISCMVHAQCAGLLRHELGKPAPVAAKIFGDDDSSVIGRSCDYRLDQILDRDSLSSLEAE